VHFEEVDGHLLTLADKITIDKGIDIMQCMSPFPEHIMLKSFFSKIKENLLTKPQTKEEKSSFFKFAVIGYSPYTRKFLNMNIPIFIDPTLSDKNSAMCYYNTFNNKVDGIGINSAYTNIFPSTFEHEAVHVDQLINPNRKVDINFTPFGNLISDRIDEVEAYTRQSYKVLHDFKSGILDENYFRIKGTFTSAMLFMLSSATNTRLLNSSTDPFLLLNKFKNQNEFAEEEDLVLSTMFNVCQDKQFLKAISVDPISRVENTIQKVNEYHASVKEIGESRTIDIFGCELPKTAFTETFKMQDMYNNLNRDGIDHFTRVSTANRSFFLNNLSSFDGEQSIAIKGLTAMLKR
jgi:hypothetical protein